MPRRYPRRGSTPIPIPLGSASVFSGSYSLTTSIASSGATYTLDPAAYAVPLGYALQYRLTGTFSGLSAADYADFAEYRTGPGYYSLSGAVAASGWADAAGGLDLTATGTVTTAASPAGSAFSNAANFSGACLLTGPVFGLAAGGAAEFFFQRSRTGVNEALIGDWDSGAVSAPHFLIYLDVAGKLNAAWYDGSAGFHNITGSTTVGSGGSHHAALTNDGTTVRLYLDGGLEASQVSGMGPGAKPFTVGQDGAGGSQFAGLIDEIRLSNAFGVRYTGSTYTVPTAPFASDTGTTSIYHLDAAPAASPSLATAWTAYPSASAACRLDARNRTAARGTLTAVTLEVRAQP